jgi:hypothetical protein
MKALGLHPSSTGDVGGKETGQRVSHYIIDGGAFDQSFSRLASLGWRLNLQSAEWAMHSDPRVKYVCPSCGDGLRGKRGLVPLCARCGRFFLPAGITEAEMVAAAAEAHAAWEQAKREAQALEIGLASTIQ